MVLGGKLQAPSGKVRIVSAASTGEIPVDYRTGPASTVTAYGAVQINGSTITVDTDGAGQSGGIHIHGGTVSVGDKSEIAADNSGSGPGGKISLRGDAQVSLTTGANVHANTKSTGPGGSTRHRVRPVWGSDGRRLYCGSPNTQRRERQRRHHRRDRRQFGAAKRWPDFSLYVRVRRRGSREGASCRGFVHRRRSIWVHCRDILPVKFRCKRQRRHHRRDRRPVEAVKWWPDLSLYVRVRAMPAVSLSTCLER